MATLKLRQRRRRPRLGPYSTKQALISIDGRCAIARATRQFAQELVAQLGGDPTPAQQILIREASIKNARILLMAEAILDKGALDYDCATKTYLAWSNSLRRDLEALGLQQAEAPRTLKAYLVDDKAA
jgi:hypothetical protein